MRISDWSSDVCSSDLSSRTTRARAASWRAAAAEEAGWYCISASTACAVISFPLTHTDRGAARDSTPDADCVVAAIRCPQICRASCRERVGQYVALSVFAVSLTKKNINIIYIYT